MKITQTQNKNNQDMKKYILLLLAAIAAQMAMAQRALFDKYEDTDGVQTVFVSKAMLSMAGGLGMLDAEIGNVVNKLEEVRILTCEKQALAKKIVGEARTFYQNQRYTELLRVNEGDEKVTIYQKPIGKKHEYALLCVEKDGVNIINLVGSLTISELKKIAD